MRILATSLGFYPGYTAGAEEMLRAVLVYLISQGHECTVLAPKGSTEPEGVVDGIRVLYGKRDKEEVNQLYKNCDWVITYLNATEEACLQAERYSKPVCHMMHFNWDSKQYGICEHNCQLMIFNSYNMWEKTGLLNIPTAVAYPPVFSKKYKVKTTRETSTLINLNGNKGGDILHHLSLLMPEEKFLGVKGSYGEQIVKPGNHIEYIEQQPDITEVYKRTGILLVLSGLETWGRVAIEAACSGIPVIATKTPGLQEALGDAGIFIDRKNIYTIQKAIQKLRSDKEYYKEMSKKVLERAKELEKQYNNQLKGIEEYMLKYISKDFSNFSESASADLFVSSDKNKIKEFSKKSSKPFVIRKGFLTQLLLSTSKDINSISTDFVVDWNTNAEVNIYKLMKPLAHNGRNYRRGSLIPLTEKEASAFKPGFLELLENKS